MKTSLICSLLLAALATVACRPTAAPTTAPGPLAAPSTAPRVASVPTPEPSPDPAHASADVLACDASASDRCISAVCDALPSDLTACTVDADCTIETFAVCECASAGPFYAVAKSKADDARTRFASTHANECACGCPGFAATCIAGTCGFAPL